MVNKWVQWLRWYKKPSYRDVKAFTESTNIALQKGETSGPPSIRSSSDATIPPNLTLERILSNQTCKSKERMSGLTVSLTGSLLSGSPLAFYDFYMYLKHIEFSQENLEFYIWSVFLFLNTILLCSNSIPRFKDYEARYREASNSTVHSEAIPLYAYEKRGVKPECTAIVSDVQEDWQKTNEKLGRCASSFTAISHTDRSKNSRAT
jgi:hypothetical protein